MPFRAPPTEAITFNTLGGTANPSSNFPVSVRHNWEAAFTVTSRFLGATTSSKYTGAEDRPTYRVRPVRTCEASALSLDISQAVRQRMYQRRITQESELFYPLSCDALPILGLAGNVFTVPNRTQRRFARGSYVMFGPADGSFVEIAGEYAPSFIARITTFSATTITVDSLPGVTIPIDGTWCIQPAIIGQGSLQQQADMLSAHAHRFNFRYEETAAITATPAFSLNEDVSGEGFDYLAGEPVFDPNHNFVASASAESRSQGESFDMGRRRLVVYDGGGPRVIYQTGSTSFGRDDWYKITRLWESRRASMRPFWFVSPEVWWDSDVTATAGSFTLTVPRRGYEIDVESLLEAMCVEMANGSVSYHVVNNIAKSGTDTLDLSLDQVLPSNGSVACVRPIYRSRFESDEMRESWLSAEVCNIDLTVISVTDEQDYEIV